VPARESQRTRAFARRSPVRADGSRMAAISVTTAPSDLTIQISVSGLRLR
jgi:hypothetical protein